MTCKEFSDLVPAFLEDALDEGSLREFLNHYDGCRACREEFEIQYLVDRVFNKMGVADGINLGKDLPAFVDRERELLRRRTRLGLIGAIMEITAVLLMVLTIFLFLT